MALFAILNKHGVPLAYHEDKRVIEEYLAYLKDKNNVLVKVKHANKVRNTEQYVERYLVKEGSGYVPAKYIDDAWIVSQEELSNYECLLDLIYRELEFNSEKMGNKKKKALIETLRYFQNRVDEIKDNPPELDVLEHMHQMREEYGNRLYRDDPKDSYFDSI